MLSIKQKIYCFVDESGQDPSSRYFIGAAVVVPGKGRDGDTARLLEIEQTAGTYGLKWHKTRARGLKYLGLVLQGGIARGRTYLGHFKKPTPYFFPIVDVIENAIKQATQNNPDYISIVYLDGIDKKKATELTNALRSHNIHLRLVRSARDESEPLIRLADMWAGCARAALLGNKEAKKLMTKAQKQGHIILVTTKRPL